MNKSHKLYGMTVEERLEYILSERKNKQRKPKQDKSSQSYIDSLRLKEEKRAKRAKEKLEAEQREKERLKRIGVLQKQRKTRESKLPPRYVSYLNRANKKKIKFTLSVEEFTRITDLKCAYCGGVGGGIDRIDSSEGYIEYNVLPCCFPCNMMKYKHSTDFFLSHVKKIYNNLKLSNTGDNLFSNH